MTPDLDAVRAMMEGGDLLEIAAGRSRFLRDRGEVKTPDLLEALAAEVEANRATIAGLTAERERLLAERPYIVGANDGWDAAVEQGATSEAVKSAMVRFWRRLAEIHLSRAEKAEATIAGLERKLADHGVVAQEAFIKWDATIAGLEARVEALTGALQWCSGSPDFNEGGQAREGWLRVCAPLLKGETP